jgi:hypothetical protein
MKRIVIVGSGITGVMTAFMINHYDPDCEITLVDAGPEPQGSSKDTILHGHYGATLGHGRDSRHFTGSEGLSFQNPVHTKLLYEMAGPNSEGWQTIPDHELSIRERRWREECVDRYKKHVTPNNNPYDDMYAALNYGGMQAWELLCQLDKNLEQFRLSDDYVYVTFMDRAALQADLTSESHFNPRNDDEKYKVKTLPIETIDEVLPPKLLDTELYHEVLRVPGDTWQIQSVWKYLYHQLSAKPNIKFVWSSPVEKVSQLPTSDAYVWAAGSAYAIPDIYSDHGRVQGVGGWWLSLPNPGFKVPFKISAPQPSGYINLTPSGDLVHISGGFGWVGERPYDEAEVLLETSRLQLLDHLSRFLNMPLAQLEQYEAGCCIRPTTPTGMPDVKSFELSGQKHLMISGAGKAGATEAPFQGLYVAQQLGSHIDLSAVRDGSIIEKGLGLLRSDLEP